MENIFKKIFSAKTFFMSPHALTSRHIERFMKKAFYLFVLLLSACICEAKPAGSFSQALLGKNALTDTLGTLIDKIEFRLKADSEESKTFTDGFVPWIRLDTPKLEINRLIDTREVVLPYQTVTLIIDYPLRNPARFKLTGRSAGFTRKMLIEMISEKYTEIYLEEEQTATIKTLPRDKRALINRNETNGKYGIWGHDLSDLALDAIEVFQRADGTIWLMLDVDS